MSREQILQEIKRVEAVLSKPISQKLRHDYGKHLKRLYRDLRYYDKAMKKWETKTIC